jgi:uncharacterized repeat protein (TIGR01451 family)
VGVSNAGPAAATSVQVVQSITSAPSTGVTFQVASGTGWSCSAGSTSVTCIRASLASGASAPPLTIQWDVGPAGGTVLAQAVVSSAEPDPVPANNTAYASTTVTAVPYTDLSISKNDGGVTVLWNRPIAYALTVSNAGPEAVTGATVADSFPASVASVTWLCGASVGSSCPASGSGTINATVNLAVGGTVTFIAAGTVVYGTLGPITNTATVTSSIYDTNTANDSATVNTPVDGDLIFEDGFQSPGVLFDSGPLITHPGGGAGGADASRMQNSSLGMSVAGFRDSVSGNYSVADDFAVPAGLGWSMTQMTFFAYQTGSTTTSTINDVRVQLWDGPPSAGGSVIWGDLTTNRLASTTFSNIYRDSETTVGNSTRPIMKVVATVPTSLAPGTYWVEWQMGGTLASGPWVPPITILGQTTTGNALQNVAGTWQAALDTGTATPQGFKFIIEGAALP